MTTDLQIMHQDEWLGALRGGGYEQMYGSLFPVDRNGVADYGTTACAIGVCVAAAGMEYGLVSDMVITKWLGISPECLHRIVRMNDGDRLSFGEIADWFKAERDACDGDLSDWCRCGR